MPVITLSRQVGSNGDAIAEQICNRLNYRYMDKWLLNKVAADVGLSQNEVVDFSEEHYKARTFLETLFGPRNRVVASVTTRQRDTTGGDMLSISYLDEAQCMNLVRTAIMAAYREGNIVIVGRGGQAILQDRLDVLHIRIEAPLEERVRRIREKEMMSELEARSHIAERDRSAAQYLERFFNVRWDDPALYHLVINTGKWDVAAAVDIIEHAVSQLQTERFPTQPMNAATA